MSASNPPLAAALDLAVQHREAVDAELAPRARAALGAASEDLANADFAGHDVRFDNLVSRLQLAPAEREILRVVAAVQRTVALQLLLGLLSGDDRPAPPTVAVTLELAGQAVTDVQAHRWLGTGTALRRSGVVEFADNGLFLSSRLSLDPRVASWLAGHDAPTPLVESLLLHPVPAPVAGADTVAAALATEGFVWIQGGPTTAALSLAEAAGRELGLPVVCADLSRRGPHTTVDAAAAAVLIEALLAGGVAVLRGAEEVSQRVLESAAGPVAALSAEPWNPTRAQTLPVTVQATRLTPTQRHDLWRQGLQTAEVPDEVNALRMSPEQIMTVALHARRGGARPGDEVTVHDLRTSARLLNGSMARPDHEPTRLEDLVLPAPAAAEVRRLLDWARVRDEVLARGPLQGKGGKGSGISALLAGPPGTGKTLAAHVVADTLALDLYQVDISTVVDKYIGETEKNLEKAFVRAESMNAVLFFDEADALFGSRSEVKDAKDRYANQEVAYLLQRMEQFDGIVLLATNLRGNLDPAFARRLHFMITFPEPDVATRAALWRHLLHQAGSADQHPPDTVQQRPIDVDALAASVDLAGGAIRNVVLAATYDAVAAGERLGLQHVGDAIRREYVKLGRRVPSEFA